MPAAWAEGEGGYASGWEWGQVRGWGFGRSLASNGAGHEEDNFPSKHPRPGPAVTEQHAPAAAACSCLADITPPPARVPPDLLHHLLRHGIAQLLNIGHLESVVALVGQALHLVPAGRGEEAWGGGVAWRLPSERVSALRAPPGLCTLLPRAALHKFRMSHRMLTRWSSRPGPAS